MTENSQMFAKMDKSGLADQYVVIVGGKVLSSGKDIEAMLERARKEHPDETPFVAKVPDERLLVL